MVARVDEQRGAPHLFESVIGDQEIGRPGAETNSASIVDEAARLDHDLANVAVLTFAFDPDGGSVLRAEVAETAPLDLEPGGAADEQPVPGAIPSAVEAEAPQGDPVSAVDDEQRFERIGALAPRAGAPRRSAFPPFAGCRRR